MGTTTTPHDSAEESECTDIQKKQSQDKQAQEGPEGKNQRLGRLGEEMACHYLRDNEFNILEQNWKCKCGEADIIAEEEGALVFIEVKTRRAGFPGLPEYAVTKEKRARYEKIAVNYLMQHQRPSGRVRFDVIAVQMTGENQCLLRHHRDAFTADA